MSKFDKPPKRRWFTGDDHELNPFGNVLVALVVFAALAAFVIGLICWGIG